ncbi:MAG: electron transport complex subunit E [Bacilli bacterium]|nr:electron transport complex subunit E [Bacilli bacterium]
MKDFTKGLWEENPVFVGLLGLCSVLAISVSIQNAIGMGVALTFVLVFSNVIISLLKKIIPYEIRIPMYIVIIATLVTIVDMVMNAYLFELHASLGIFIPLIVVNCIILGRAEGFASKNSVSRSFLDGLGMGIGYTLSLIILSLIREILGSGTITIWENIVIDINKLFQDQGTLLLFTDLFLKPSGAFIIFGLLLGVISTIKINRKKKLGDKV